MHLVLGSLSLSLCEPPGTIIPWLTGREEEGREVRPGTLREPVSDSLDWRFAVTRGRELEGSAGYGAGERLVYYILLRSTSQPLI